VVAFSHVPEKRRRAQTSSRVNGAAKGSKANWQVTLKGNAGSRRNRNECSKVMLSCRGQKEKILGAPG